MNLHALFEQRSLLQQAVLRERIAERAAELAKEADRTRQSDLAGICWAIVRRSRVYALKLRPKAEACKIR